MDRRSNAFLIEAERSITSDMNEKHPGKPAAGWASSRRGRWAVSVLVLLHLAAVFSNPMFFASSLGTEPSPVAQVVRDTFGPYIQMAYLDHGYFFFAPNPGPSHLVRYRAEFAEGRRPVEGTFPDLQQQWPRLLYHRHFMLSEFLHHQVLQSGLGSEPPPPSLDPAANLSWQRARQGFRLVRNAFGQHLRSKYDAARVHLMLIEHRQPTPAEFESGVGLDDPRLLQQLDLTGVDQVIQPGTEGDRG